MDGCDPATISDSQYCYTIPEIYGIYDNYDDNDQWYHGIETINVGATITISKICAPDYQYPGERFRNMTYGDKDCADLAGRSKNCVKSFPVDTVIAHLVHTPNGYISLLNCPECGCTATDIVTLDEREVGTA